MKKLYHGSNNGLITVLDPSKSCDEKVVYATDNYMYALIRAGSNEGLIREEYYGLKKPIELAEALPGQFLESYNCTGYIYVLDGKDFELSDNGLEYISRKKVIPVDRITVPNIFDWMRRFNVDRDFYDLHWWDDEEYWKTVEGGRDGFIFRKIVRRMLLELEAE